MLGEYLVEDELVVKDRLVVKVVHLPLGEDRSAIGDILSQLNLTPLGKVNRLLKMYR